MITTIFKRFLAMIWHYFDFLCFVSALIVADYGAFLFGKPWGVMAVAATLFVMGWLSEVVSADQDKGSD
ncbi:DUF1056 family protein [Secundilactobacillus collinoides]|uniref:Prophage protein n=1 Tax=Secundilactobacillus collinoides TaxID=33960 RepID=A0A166GD96_SECCO|nr:DUF1056 family protein [Secundilactobacillus collinoides]KZL38725.1 prophage protein [Secundilactobacillus collinoides]